MFNSFNNVKKASKIGDTALACSTLIFGLRRMKENLGTMVSCVRSSSSLLLSFSLSLSLSLSLSEFTDRSLSDPRFGLLLLAFACLPRDRLSAFPTKTPHPTPRSAWRQTDSYASKPKILRRMSSKAFQLAAIYLRNNISVSNDRSSLRTYTPTHWGKRIETQFIIYM